jgi:hypothetical protein
LEKGLKKWVDLIFIIKFLTMQKII